MKRNYKRVIPVILAFIIGISTTVGAATVFNSKDITYSSDKTTKTNVKDSLDELYSLLNKPSTNLPVSGMCNQVAKPNLGTNDILIPVTIQNDGKVIKVSEENSSWYDYCNKKWGNAVILNNGKKKNDIPNGTIIPEENINSYFVWIPKYKYKLWNVESTMESETARIGAHSINIIFDTKDTTDVEGVSCKTPLISGESGNCDNGEYMTHPSFITMGVNGFWVGKYEVSNLSTAVQIDGKNTNISVVPGVASWRNINVKTMFDNSYNYSRTLNSHMMKNTEWGAVAYLSHSRYGINTEININNNDAYLTGYSANLNTKQDVFPGETGNGGTYNSPYNTETGYLASTTGNISGIYDMSGGALEYLSSYKQGSFGQSGFDAINIGEYDSKYFDVYNKLSENQTYQYRILGDATGEVGPFPEYEDKDNVTRWHTKWYSDVHYFVSTREPWIWRSGLYRDGIIGGLFHAGSYLGIDLNDASYRLVLSE